MQKYFFFSFFLKKLENDLEPLTITFWLFFLGIKEFLVNSTSYELGLDCSIKLKISFIPIALNRSSFPIFL